VLLDGDLVAIELGIAGGIDHPHAARADGTEDAIPTELCAAGKAVTPRLPLERSGR
jgi:hypothetical protein